MKTSHYTLSESESRQSLWDALEGRVFHATKLEHLDSIQATGSILTNADSTLQSSFGSSQKGFFRLRDCVSVFDYRASLPEELIEFRYRCSPFQPAAPGAPGVAILFLKPETYPRLIPWTAWKDAGNLSHMVVPHVEAGHPGPLSLSDIDELMTVTITEDPDSLPGMLRAARRKHAG